jgi:hypothetical protein
MNEQRKAPFKSLGARLKQVREKLQESLAEVSGAVEVDIDVLAAIEQGEKCPAEDILLLLISHFGLKEDEATKLWEMAGFDQKALPASNMTTDEQGNLVPTVVVMPVDSRISYTDQVHVTVNNYGVVMNFLQAAGQGQPLPVARLGMSKEHARSIIEVLQKTLDQSEPKALPEHRANTDKRRKN